MRLVRCVSLPMALALFLCGCDSRSGGAQAPAPPAQAEEPSPPASGGQAPTRLFYPNDPAVYVKDVAITPNPPFSTGGTVTSYRVSPALPAGLSLNAATGVISGTPTALAATAGYEVTGSNGAGGTSVTLTLTVIDQAPALQPVVTIAPFVTASAAGLAASTQDQGADLTYTWTVRGGTLSSGQGTPAITFAAGAPGTLEVSVAVANSGGTVTGRARNRISKPWAMDTGDSSEAGWLGLRISGGHGPAWTLTGPLLVRAVPAWFCTLTWIWNVPGVRATVKPTALEPWPEVMVAVLVPGTMPHA